MTVLTSTSFGDPLLLRSRAGMIPANRALELEERVRELLRGYDMGSMKLAHCAMSFDRVRANLAQRADKYDIICMRREDGLFGRPVLARCRGRVAGASRPH